MTKRVLILPSDIYACGTERMTKPYNLIAIKYDNKDTGIEFDVVDLNAISQIPKQVFIHYDAILLQRPNIEGYLPLIKDLKAHGKKIVIESDDLLTNLSPTNTCYDFYH